jgi:hypothetical protein
MSLTFGDRRTPACLRCPAGTFARAYAANRRAAVESIVEADPSCVRTIILPRMADFALWAAACETAFWPAGTFARAYAANRRAAVESIIEADPLATCVRTIMGKRSMWSGTASDLLRLCAESAREDTSMNPPWAKNPRALAGRLRRAQTFLRMLDIDISFAREGQSGARMIRMSALGQNRSRTVEMDWGREIAGSKPQSLNSRGLANVPAKEDTRPGHKRAVRHLAQASSSYLRLP